MIRLFCGFDARESIGFAVFAHSVITRASVPVAITPLASMGMPVGTNAFTVSRFLVPWLCGFKGQAIFADGSDMLMQADVRELTRLFDPRYAVQTVQHPDYRTRHPRKYVGTEMEADNRDYPRKNWASLMLFNCGHDLWQGVDPQCVSRAKVLDLLQLRTALFHGAVGDVPPEWNVLADEGQSIKGAKLLHWTAGIPGFEHYREAPGAALWHAERAAMEGAPAPG